MKLGDRIGDYEIISELGRGGMGRVFKVRNIISDRIEAMKILLPDLAGRQELVARFLREIKLVASLNHPNIGALRTALTLDDQLVMIMEYVEGSSLDDRIEQGNLTLSEILTYTDQALQALSHAHQRGVVHRDIKPANIMITPEGIAKVMDFGIAFSGSEQKLTATGTTLGSLAYMSPEQVQGGSADPRSDLYSLGISLYEMVTGQRPFKGDSDFAIMAAHVKESPRPPIELQPGLPNGLNSLILTAIAKEKEGRFQNADAFRNALGSVTAGADASVAPGRHGAAADSTIVVTPATPLPVPRAPQPPPSVRTASAFNVPAPAPPQPRPATRVAPVMPPASQIPPPPPVQSGNGSRGLYLALGAVLAIILLVAAGTYYKSGAAGGAQPAVSPAPTSKPVAPPATQPAEPAPATSDAAATPVPSADTPAPAPAVAKPLAPASTAKSAPPAAQEKPAAKAPDISAQLDELETQLDQLTTRALAVDSSLETLRAQQRRQGLDLRSDMAARQEGMKLNLSKAREAFKARDVVRGKRYADQTEAYVSQLEKFLGR